MEAEDFGGAERLSRNCLARTTSSASLSSIYRTSKVGIMTLLVKSCEQQGKWSDVQSILIEKIALGSRSVAGNNSDVLSNKLNLVELLLKKEACAETLLYGWQALKGYRRMGVPGTDGVSKALRLLITICHAESRGTADEEEADTAILYDFTDRQASKEE